MTKKGCSNCRYTHTYDLTLCNPSECVPYMYKMWAEDVPGACVGACVFDDDDLYISGSRNTLTPSGTFPALSEIPLELLHGNGKAKTWAELLKEYERQESKGFPDKTCSGKTCLNCLHCDQVHDYSDEYVDIFNICSLQQRNHIVKLTSLDPCAYWEEKVRVDIGDFVIKTVLNVIDNG